MANSKNAASALAYQTVNEKASFLEQTPGGQVDPAKKSPTMKNRDAPFHSNPNVINTEEDENSGLQ